MIDKKVLLCTHCDLDGASCAIVTKNTFKDVTNVHVSAGDGLTKYIRHLQETPFLVNNYDMVTVQDLSLDTALFADLMGVFQVAHFEGEFLMLDHHESSNPIADEENGVIIDMSMCGAALAQKYMQETYKVDLSHLDELIKLTNDYDLWVHKYKESKQLNILLENYMGRSTPEKGVKAFVDIYHKGFCYDKITSLEKKIILNRFEEIQKTFDELEVMELGDDTKIGFAFIEGSMLNDIAAKVFKHSDYQVIITFYPNRTGGSIRVADGSPLNLGKLLPLLEKKLGIKGGGHPHAAAYNIPSISYKMTLAS